MEKIQETINKDLEELKKKHIVQSIKINGILEAFLDFLTALQWSLN